MTSPLFKIRIFVADGDPKGNQAARARELP
jgi:hypothetical protein